LSVFTVPSHESGQSVDDLSAQLTNKTCEGTTLRRDQLIAQRKAGGEQVIVAGLDDVDQLALQRPCAVPVLAGGDHFDLKLRTILGDEALEQLVRVFQFLLKLSRAASGVLPTPILGGLHRHYVRI
jgi:hypothetical protein